MKGLEEDKNDYAHSIGYKNWEECINDQPNYKVEKLLDKFYHFRINKAVAQALEEAAEKATLNLFDWKAPANWKKIQLKKSEYSINDGSFVSVNKDSILELKKNYQ